MNKVKRSAVKDSVVHKRDGNILKAYRRELNLALLSAVRPTTVNKSTKELPMIVTNGKRTYLVTTTKKYSLVKCLDIQLNTELWLPERLVAKLPEVSYTRKGYN